MSRIDEALAKAEKMRALKEAERGNISKKKGMLEKYFGQPSHAGEGRMFIRFIAGHRRQIIPALAAIAVVLAGWLSFLAPAHNESAAPSVLGQLSMGKDTNVWRICRNIFGSVDQNLFTALMRANSEPGDWMEGKLLREKDIENVQIMNLNNVITVPAIRAPGKSIINKTWIEVARAKTLQKAYDLFSTYARSMPKVVLFPFWNPREKLVFALVLKEHFPDRKTAQKVIEKLPSPMMQDARILDRWDDGTVFYYRLSENTTIKKRS